MLRDEDAVEGVVLSNETTISAPLVINAAGPHSSVINAMAGVLDEFRVTTRPLRQEVHQVTAANVRGGVDSLPLVGDGDLGTYFRQQPGGSLLVGSQEPDCDPLVWLSDADRYDPSPTTATHEAQVTRLARRVPDVGVPNRPSGIVGVYDVTEDWIPIYDRTSLAGYYVAIGTSGNQFKNAPVVGLLMLELIRNTEAGCDHDSAPLRWTLPITGAEVNLGHYSRLRQMNPDSTLSVLG
jgi:sarcosine oxidase subunit beta